MLRARIRAAAFALRAQLPGPSFLCSPSLPPAAAVSERGRVPAGPPLRPPPWMSNTPASALLRLGGRPAAGARCHGDAPGPVLNCAARPRPGGGARGRERVGRGLASLFRSGLRRRPSAASRAPPRPGPAGRAGGGPGLRVRGFGPRGAQSPAPPSPRPPLKVQVPGCRSKVALCLPHSAGARGELGDRDASAALGSRRPSTAPALTTLATLHNLPEWFPSNSGEPRCEAPEAGWRCGGRGREPTACGRLARLRTDTLLFTLTILEGAFDLLQAATLASTLASVLKASCFIPRLPLCEGEAHTL